MVLLQQQAASPRHARIKVDRALNGQSWGVGVLCTYKGRVAGKSKAGAGRSVSKSVC
jgi:hypothetical protein